MAGQGGNAAVMDKVCMTHPDTLWQTRFPQLAVNDPALVTLRNAARQVTLPPGTCVFRAGNSCDNYLLVIEGTVRVTLLGDEGREVVLYRVGPGQSCVLTTSCLLGKNRYPAEGHTEALVTAWVLPRAAFEDALDHSPAFRQYVFANLGARLADVIRQMETITFHSITRRLASCLLAHADTQGALETTHQQIAVELGSAREVISRQLKRFEAEGLVRVQRGGIELTDIKGLQRLAHGG